MFVPGGGWIGIDSSDRSIQPLTDRTKVLVIERIGSWVAEGAVGLNPIPVLPECCRPACHLVKPRRIRLPVEQPIRLLKVAKPAQHIQQVWCAQHAGGEVSASAHRLNQVPRG